MVYKPCPDHECGEHNHHNKVKCAEPSMTLPACSYYCATGDVVKCFQQNVFMHSADITNLDDLSIKVKKLYGQCVSHSYYPSLPTVSDLSHFLPFIEA